MEQKSLRFLHKELTERRIELLRTVDTDIANRAFISIRKTLSQYNLSLTQTKALLNYFYWFYCENDN